MVVSPSEVDPPEFVIPVDVREQVERIAYKVTQKMMDEIRNVGLEPDHHETTQELAIDLSFLHEIATAIILRCMGEDHPLQQLITECLSLST